MLGIDIYHGDGNPLKAVPSKAYKESDFIIIKATQGTSYKYTSYFTSMIKKAINDGKLCGAYHYAAGGDPEKEADYFVSIVKNYVGKVILCLDWEKIQNKAWGSKTWCTKFINRVKKKTNVTCFLYTGLDGCTQNKTLAKKVPLWFAGYPKNENSWTVPKFKYDLGVWDNYTIWQFTSGKGKCDRNTTNLTEKQWKLYAKGDNVVTVSKEAELRKKVVESLTMMIGIHEGSAEHKMIINKFNASGLCTRYKMTANDAWCATAVSFAFIVNKLAGKPGSGALCQFVECSCAKMVELGKKQGIFVENDAYVPKIGDVIFYDWQDSGVGDNKGNPDHVGLVMSVTGNVIKVVEGNKNDAIGTRQIKVNAKTIRGFITPKYSQYVNKTTVAKAYTGKLPKLPKRGYFKYGDGITTLKDSKDQIELVQKAVNWAIGSSLKIDGEYGTKTKAAVEKLQRRNKLYENGCYGNKCQAVIQNMKK